MPRRNRQKPFQRKLSVQDIRDLNAPDSAARIDEEFRRLRFSIDQVTERVAPESDVAVVGAAAGASGPSAPVKPGPAADLPDVDVDSNRIKTDFGYINFQSSRYIRVVGVPRGTGADIRFDLEPQAITPLTVWNKTNASGADFSVQSVEHLEFDDDGQTSTEIPVNFVVDRRVSGRARVRAYVPDMSGGTPYTWIAADLDETSTIDAGETVKFIGAGALGVELDPGSNTFVISRNLTTELDGFAVGDAATEILNFDSNGQTTLDVAVRFNLVDVGGGRRTIRAYVPDMSGGSYTWTVADADESAVVADTETVTFTGSNGTTVELDTATQTIDVSRPLTIEDDDVAVGGADTTVVNFNSGGQTSMDVAVNFTVTDDGAGQRTVRGYVPASGGGTMDSWFLGINAETPGEEISDGELVRLVEGTNINLSRTGNDITISADPYPVYNWNLDTNADASPTSIDDGETVTFVGQNGVKVTRSGNSIIIEEDEEYGGGGDTDYLKMGYIEFDTTNTDAISGAKPAYMYGVRKYVDIVHNWNLANMHAYELQLRDVALNASGDLTPDGYFRDGAGAMNGQDFGETYGVGPSYAIPFRNFPHWGALDSNTIRVWATQSRNKPTVMRFWYVLRKAV